MTVYTWLLLKNVSSTITKPESKVDITQIEWSPCTVSIILYLIHFGIVTSLLFFLSVTGYFTASYLLCALPWLLLNLLALLAVAIAISIATAAAACFMLLSVRCAYVLENGYWFFPRFWWRQRNEDTSIGPEWFAPSFYWIPYYVSSA